MKRSEFVNKVIELIKSERPYSYDPSYEILIDDVIYHAEKLGMLPPTRSNPSYSGSWQDSYSNIPAKLNKWEPEGE